MKLEEGQIVYVCLNDVPTQSRITALNFGGDGVHLVCTLPERQSYIVDEYEIADNAHDCFVQHKKHVQEEYELYHQPINSAETLILHLLHAAVNGRRINGIEKLALIARASQFTQIDVEQYLVELDKIEKESRKNHDT